MTAVPDRLTVEQCKLLQKLADRLGPVLQRYNQAVAVAQTLASQFPDALKQIDPQEALVRLTRTRAALTTPRFKVGFLGPFQCGKSTILNKLIGQDVSAIGVGKACTSVITRLVVAPGRTVPELSLQYFCEEDYRERRNKLSEWARVSNPAVRTEVQLLEFLKTHNPNAAGGGAHRPVLKKDVPYLRAFLQSYEDAKPKNLVRPEPHREIVSYADRERLLMHDPDAAEDDVRPSQYLLVAESNIRFSTDHIDPELELIDCPGLGSGRSVDDLLTGEYIQQLDGALVFLRAGAMDSKEVSEILQALQHKFRDNLKSRVWVVVNQMDVPEKHAKIGALGKKTTFDVIVDLMKDNNIPLSQVILGCNGIYEQAAAAGGIAARSSALATIKLTPEDDKLVKGRLAAHPALDAAYEELLKDGSISLLKRLIKERVGPSVAAEILVQAEADTGEALSELEYALKQAEQPASEQEQNDAVEWDTALFVLLCELSGGRASGRGALFVKLEELGRAARSHLEKAFLARFPDDRLLDDLNLTEIIGRFPLDAKRMQTEVNKEFDLAVQSAYTEVTELLEKQNLPPIALPDGGVPLALWQEYRQQDRDGGPWRECTGPRMADATFLALLSEQNLATTFNGPKYKRLLLEKLRTSAQQLTLAVRGQLRHRLGSIRRQVRRKLGARAPHKLATPE